MISRLLASIFGRSKSPEAERPGAPDLPGVPGVPAGAALYAIGDIHGRLDLLAPLVALIRTEAAAAKTIVVTLGDYIDRGADSRGVVEMLADLAQTPGIEAHFLRGNHDQILLEFLEDPTVGPYWRRVGGGETLFSYGVEPPGTRKHMERWQAARDAFAASLPERHLRFFQDLNLSFTWGDYFFAHAGALPGTPLEAQTEEHLLWIRKPFLEHEGRFDRIVVHGHTPAAEAYADHRRVGLDTGAYMTGVLSACRFEGGGRRLIQAVEMPDAPPEIRTRPL